MPTCRRSSSGLPRSPAGAAGPYSTPSTRTEPSLGSSSRLIVRSSVDLPEPDGPKMTTCSPGVHRQVDAVQHLDVPNDLRIPSSSTTTSLELAAVSGAPAAADGGLSVVIVGVRIVP